MANGWSCAVVNDKTRRAGDEDNPAESVNAGEDRDRTAEARDERAEAHDDASQARDKRAISSIDELTRAHRRDAGLVELTRDLARAKRMKQPFALAFIDVDNLKAKNDSLGHPAGDKLLRDTADSIRAHLRSYDLLIRCGGDEFLCGLIGLTMAAASKRFSLVNADPATTQKASVTIGLTELKGDDGVEELIGQADAAMYKERQRVRSKRPAAAKRSGKRAPAVTGTSQTGRRG